MKRSGISFSVFVLNAPSPMAATFNALPNSTTCKLVHPSNAFAAMSETVDGIYKYFI